MTETEATLVVVSERPEDVLNSIDGLTTLGPYKLVPGPLLKIEDDYFDTADKALTARKWAFRLRRMGPETRITLKGPSKTADWGGVERLEMDLPGDADSLSKILAELPRRQLGITFPEDWRLSGDLLSTLTAAGLQVVQHRRTTRKLKNALDAEFNILTAELALDSVSYALAQGEVLHFEVEIEARDVGNPYAVRAILALLMNLYGSELLLWPHSKLATGQAVAGLAHRFQSAEWFKAGRLSRTDYEMIERCLIEKSQTR